MNSKTQFILLAIIAAIGAYLLGDGVTGMVVVGAQPANSSISLLSAMWGALLLLMVIATIYLIYHTRKHKV